MKRAGAASLPFPVLALSLLLAGCTPPDPPTVSTDFVYPDAWSVTAPSSVQRGETLRIGVLNTGTTLNPFRIAQTETLLQYLSAPGGLLINDPVTGTPVPYMAVKVVTSADGLTWDFTLRDDLAWSDGKPIRPEDFLSTIAIHQDQAVGSNDFDTVREMTATKTGDRSLRIVFSTPRATNTTALTFNPQPDHVFGTAYRSGGAVAVRALWPKTEPATNLVTSGPFRARSIAADGSAVLERNPHYGAWAVDTAGKPVPYLDTLEVKVYASLTEQYAAFKAGQLDLLNPTPTQAAELRNVGGIVLRENYSSAASNQWIVWNFNRVSDPEKQRLFRETAFRQAMSHLVNRQRMVDEVYGGAAEPLYNSVYPVFDDWVSTDAPKFEFNVAEARRLLATLGYSTLNSEGYLVNSAGRVLEFDLITNSGNTTREALMRIFAEEARRAGVKVNAQPTAFNDVVNKLSAAGTDRPFDAILLGLSNGGDQWPFGANVVPCDGNLHAYNRSGACLFEWESQMQTLFNQGSQTMDRTQRIALGRQLQAIEAQHQPFVYLTAPKVSAAWRDRVQGEYPNTIANSFYGTRSLALTWIKP